MGNTDKLFKHQQHANTTTKAPVALATCSVTTRSESSTAPSPPAPPSSSSGALGLLQKFTRFSSFRRSLPSSSSSGSSRRRSRSSVKPAPSHLQPSQLELDAERKLNFYSNSDRERAAKLKQQEQQLKHHATNGGNKRSNLNFYATTTTSKPASSANGKTSLGFRRKSCEDILGGATAVELDVLNGHHQNELFKTERQDNQVSSFMKNDDRRGEHQIKYEMPKEINYSDYRAHQPSDNSNRRQNILNYYVSGDLNGVEASCHANSIADRSTLATDGELISRQASNGHRSTIGRSNIVNADVGCAGVSIRKSVDFEVDVQAEISNISNHKPANADLESLNDTFNSSLLTTEDEDLHSISLQMQNSETGSLMSNQTSGFVSTSTALVTPPFAPSHRSNIYESISPTETSPSPRGQHHHPLTKSPIYASPLDPVANHRFYQIYGRLGPSKPPTESDCRMGSTKSSPTKATTSPLNRSSSFNHSKDYYSGNLRNKYRTSGQPGGQQFPVTGRNDSMLLVLQHLQQKYPQYDILNSYAKVKCYFFPSS